MGATPITGSHELLESLGFHVTEQPMLDLFNQCTPEEEQVLRLLSAPLLKSDVIRKLGIPIYQANVLISQMELKGLIRDVGGELRRN